MCILVLLVSCSVDEAHWVSLKSKLGDCVPLLGPLSICAATTGEWDPSAASGIGGEAMRGGVCQEAEKNNVVPGLTNEGPRIIRRAAGLGGTRPAAVQAIPTYSE